ncbi:LCP family protein [Streptomyces sp. NPDC003077]|uniref:LCP family protein n=1 Tax=Streptomyces sp. NPDC003077 TaxID=3154443 RepID=UPI0033A0416A
MAAGNRTTVGGHGGRRPLRAVGLLLLSLLVLFAVGAGWIYFKIDGNITTFGAEGMSPDRPAVAVGGRNVLLIGTDSRAGDNHALGGGRGTVGRSDTAILLHVHEDGRHAVAVSIPRDTLVDIPPCRLPDGSWTAPRRNAMFNSAFSVGRTRAGNPACTQNTIEQMSGVRVDHTVVIDFQGFARMTSAVGGVPVCVPEDVYEGDLNPRRGSRGRLVLPKGPQTVSGQHALDYVRVRHGIGDGSDIGRIQRQQAFLASLLKKIKGQGFNPTTLLPLADAATKSMTVDPGLDSPNKLLSFALSLRDLDLRGTTFVTLPWHSLGDRVTVAQPAADELWAAIKADRPVESPGGRNGQGTGHAGTRTGGAPGAEARGDGSPGTGDSHSSAPVDGARAASDDLCAGLSHG